MRSLPDQSWYSLRVRALMGLGAVGILLPALGAFWVNRDARAALATRVRAGQVGVSRSLATEIAASVGAAVTGAKAAAHRPGLRSWVEQRNVPAQKQVLDNVLDTTPSLKAVFVIDLQGRVISKAPPSAPKPPREVTTGTTGRVFRLHRSGNDALLPVRERVLGSKGKPVGLLIALISVDRTVPGLRGLTIGRTGRASLVDAADFRVLVTGEPRRLGTSIVAPALRRIIRSSQAATTTYRNTILERDEFAAVAPVKGFRWSVLVEEAEAETFAPVAAMNRRVGVAVAFLILAGLAVAVVVAQMHARYEQRLRERIDEQTRLSEALDVFAGRVAHDVRSPLSAIQMSVDLAQQAPDDAAMVATSLDIIGRQSRKGLTLVDQLLGLARASGTPKPEPLDVPAIASEVAAEIDGLELRTECDGASVLADPVSIRQAIANLIQNASRYGSTNGEAEVLVRCLSDENGWRISVSDRGPGVPERDASTIFAPFRRGDVAPTGSGLGLAIVFAAAKAHGGRAWYEPREGGGAVFSIYLPRPAGKDGTAQSVSPPASEATPSSGPQGAERLAP